tara:strand:+ start:1415 stop:1531 length:117 start_codon:yes stop_codon:yes gene_type:complete
LFKEIEGERNAQGRESERTGDSVRGKKIWHHGRDGGVV